MIESQAHVGNNYTQVVLIAAQKAPVLEMKGGAVDFVQLTDADRFHAPCNLILSEIILIAGCRPEMQSNIA
jgi:hypothetical protein